MSPEALTTTVTQEEFGRLVGVSQQAVSALVVDGVLPRGASLGAWLLAYCGRLREQAAGRLGADHGGLDLVQERAALAREQRIAQAMKNQVARGEYAPIGVLADVLALASSSVADRFDQIEGALRKARPDIDDDLLMTVLGVVTSARNEWVRATSRLVDVAFEDLTGDDPEDLVEPSDIDQDEESQP